MRFPPSYIYIYFRAEWQPVTRAIATATTAAAIGRQGTPQPSGKGSATGLLSGDLERLRLSRKHVFFPYEGGDWEALKNRENQHNSLHFLCKNEFSPI